MALQEAAEAYLVGLFEGQWMQNFWGAVREEEKTNSADPMGLQCCALKMNQQ